MVLWRRHTTTTGESELSGGGGVSQRRAQPPAVAGKGRFAGGGANGPSTGGPAVRGERTWSCRQQGRRSCSYVERRVPGVARLLRLRLLRLRLLRLRLLRLRPLRLRLLRLQGGQDDPSNFQAICPACHRRKTERNLLAAVEPTEVD